MRLVLAILFAAGLTFLVTEALGTAPAWAAPNKECCT
jgi:hypothetical protein